MTAYQPKGRTDESSYDYTDDPRSLRMKFSDEDLREALDFAHNGYAILKFDYEEDVPVAAVRAALEES